jgi:hypothetical protein
MKRIKYKFLSAEINRGTEEEPKLEKVILNKSMTWSEANEEIAMREAYKGEYTIEDDGQPEPKQTPEERIAELEEALALLLSGVTE